MNTLQQKNARSRRDLERQIFAKAWSDGSFAEELRANPKAAIAKEFGMQVPKDLKIEIIEENLEGNTWHLVIPTAELSEAELATVAGGISSEPVYNKPPTHK